MVDNSNKTLNNISLDEYGIQTNIKPVFLDLMTYELIMLFSMQLFKYLCNLKSLHVHLQPKLLKYFDNEDVCDFLYASEF
jgi:hypothetical protein